MHLDRAWHSDRKCWAKRIWWTERIRWAAGIARSHTYWSLRSLATHHPKSFLVRHDPGLPVLSFQIVHPMHSWLHLAEESLDLGSKPLLWRPFAFALLTIAPQIVLPDLQ
ncbi:hypothetical protein QQP08_008613 [Theobroma cacao]|nr:hypothetical protein QQP08_008613 [Theobroma cacao]